MKKWGVEQVNRQSPQLSQRRLRLFGHLARADPSQDHSHNFRAAINRPPAGWRRRAGWPRRTWLRTIELDLRPHNNGFNTAWMRVRIVQSGVSLWTRLCSMMGALRNDDDDQHIIGHFRDESFQSITCTGTDNLTTTTKRQNTRIT